MLQQAKNKSVSWCIRSPLKVVNRQGFSGVSRLQVPAVVCTWRESALGPGRDRSVECLRAFVKQVEGPDVKRPTGKIEASGC